jgi:hypothetical protein
VTGTLTSLTFTVDGGIFSGGGVLKLRSASGQELVSGGVYDGATMVPAGDPPTGATHEMLWGGPISWPAVSCGLPPISSPPINGTGRFIIDELVRDGSNNPTAVAVRFEFHCDPYATIIFGAVAFNATIAYPTHAFSPSPVVMPNTLPGETSAAAPVQISNSGGAPLDVASVTLGGADAAQFNLDASGCDGASVAAGQSCSVSLTFSPTGGAGSRSATLTVFDTIARSGPGAAGRQLAISGTAPGPEGEFSPLPPSRILDTRNGTGGSSGPVGANQSISLTALGAGGIPASDVSAVVLNVTAVLPSAPTFVTVYPHSNSSSVPPLASNLNVAGTEIAVPNLVSVRVGDDGKVDLYNKQGAVFLVADVMGYYATDFGDPGSRFHGTTPVRLLDTRDGTGGGGGPIGSNSQRVLDILGVGSPVPAGATGVVLNVTAVLPSAPSYLTVFPDGQSPPLASNLNFVPGQVVPNLVMVKLPTAGSETGKVRFYNNSGAVHVIADVVGYFDGDESTEAGRFVPIDPVRFVDTRVDLDGPLGPDELLLVEMDSSTTTDSVFMNVTAVLPTSSSYLTVFPGDAPSVPLASNLNYGPGVVVPNAVVSKIGLPTDYPPFGVIDGVVMFYNNLGFVHVIVDVSGFYTAA